MKHPLRLALFAGLLAAGAADAQSSSEPGRSFAGIMGGQLEYSEEGFDDLNFTAITGRIGHDFNPFFGLEVRGGTSIDDDEFMGVEISVPYFVSGLARFGWLPVDGNRVGVYGLAGYTTGKLEAEFMGFEADETEDGFSFGAGVELLAIERHGLNIEYIRYLDEEINGADVEITHIGAGYVYRF